MSNMTFPTLSPSLEQQVDRAVSAQVLPAIEIVALGLNIDAS